MCDSWLRAIFLRSLTRGMPGTPSKSLGLENYCRYLLLGVCTYEKWIVKYLVHDIDVTRNERQT